MYLIAAGVFTLLSMIVTLVIGHLCVTVKAAPYYGMMFPLVLAELLLGLAVAWQCFCRAKARIMPMGAMIAIFAYFAFALFMIIPYALGASLTALLIPNMLVVLVLVGIVGSFGLAQHHAKESAPRFAAKKMFKLEIVRFQQERQTLLAADPALAAKVGEVAEAFRFASDTVPGAENADSRMVAALERLHVAGASGDAAAVGTVLDELLSLNTWRQTVIREMR